LQHLLTQLRIRHEYKLLDSRFCLYLMLKDATFSRL
jgi:hypothetical protein